MLATTTQTCQSERHGRTKAFETSAGVLQGSLISPILFLILINNIKDIMDEIQCEGIKVGSIKVSNLLYADDLVLLSNSPFELQKMLDKCAEYGRIWRLKFNAQKTEIQPKKVLSGLSKEKK